MTNYFETLNEALSSEGLLDLWPMTGSIAAGQTASLAISGKWISIYRCSTGRYERPIHYATQMEDSGLLLQ